MIRTSRPPGVRLALAESKADENEFRNRRARAWFRCARVDTHKSERGTDEIAYPTNQDWQKDLAHATGYTDALEDFKPREVPIVLPGPDPMQWLDLHLACWSANCTGRHLLSGAYRRKTDEFMGEAAQAEALHAQGIDPADVERAETWIGTASEKNSAGGHNLIPCDPLTCKHFNSPDKAKCCKPVVDFSFTVTWARNQTAGSFVARAWGSMARLKTTVEDLQDLLKPFNHSLAGVPCVLTVDPRAVSYDGGKTGTQPAVSISLKGTLDELAERAERLLALGAINVDQKALPEAPQTLREIRETRAGRLGTSSEFDPEAYDAQMTAEGDFRKRYSGRLSEAVIDNLLHQFDGDLEGADAAAENMLPKPDVPDEEEVIDAEFSEDEEDAEEIQAALKQYREAASDIPADVQKQWFEEVGAVFGEHVTLAQAKALVEKAGGAG